MSLGSLGRQVLLDYNPACRTRSLEQSITAAQLDPAVQRLFFRRTVFAMLLPIPNRRSLLERSSVALAGTMALMAGLLQPQSLPGRTQRQRPVEEVIAEIRELPGRMFIFVDDNLTADPEYAKRLFTQLQPLRKTWVTQSTLAITKDPDLVRLMATSGCVGLFVGLETFAEVNLTSVNKTCHHVDEYRRAIDLLHRYGIVVEAGIVFGFDGDGPEVFRRTMQVLEVLEVDLIQASIFTPLPGTPRATQLAGRVFDHQWANYDFHHVVFQPARMRCEQLQAGHDWVTRRFYSPWHIVRRLVGHLRRPRAWASLPFLAAVNFAYLGRVLRWHIRGRDPAAASEPRVRPRLGQQGFGDDYPEYCTR